MPVVQNPSVNDVHVSRPLTNFAQKYLQDTSMFVSQQAMPIIPVAKQADNYFEFNRGDFFRRQETDRAPGTAPREIGFNLSTETYNARVYGLRTPIADEERTNQDEAVALDESSVELVTQQLMISREVQFAETYMATDVWHNGGNAPSAGQNVNWASNTSEPIREIRTAVQGVHKQTGFRPNSILTTRSALDTLLDNDDILSRIIGGATTSVPAMVQRQRLAELLEFDNIYVMDAVSNEAKEGEEDQFGFIADDSFLVYYKPANVNSTRTASAGAQFAWTGLFGATEMGIRILKYRAADPGTRSDYVDGEMSYDMKVTGPALGHLFTSVSQA